MGLSLDTMVKRRLRDVVHPLRIVKVVRKKKVKLLLA